MLEARSGLSRDEGVESVRKSCFQREHGSGFESLEMLLELRPAQFNGIEIRGVGRKVAQRSSRGFDALPHADPYLQPGGNC